MNILLPTITVGLGIVSIALGVSFGITRWRNNDLATALRQATQRINNLLKENVHLQDDLDTTRTQRDRLNRENEQLHKANGVQAKQNLDLHAKNADLREALQEAKATVELLRMPSDHATVPLVEAAPLSYAETKPAIEQAAQSTPAKRPTKRGKITGGAQ